MNIIIALCLACLLAILFTTVVTLCRQSAKDRLKYLKNFKKGRFVLVYLVAIPLYCIGIVYSDVNIGGAMLMAIRACVELVVLKFDYNSIAMLLSDNMLYRITMIICFVLVIINAIMFTFALIGRRIVNSIRLYNVRNMSRKIFVVIGINQQNQHIITSITHTHGRVLLLAEDSEDTRDFCYLHKVAFCKFGTGDNLSHVMARLFGNYHDRHVNVIINTYDDAVDIVYVQQIADIVVTSQLTQYAVDSTKGLNCYVFGDMENLSAFNYFVEKTKGCIAFVNRYKLVAMDFVAKYPLTEYMTSQHIDYATATIKDNVSINMVMIGFGKTNQQIFLTSVANNQFLTMTNGVVKDKPINYYIYDRQNSRSDKNLNHNYYRFANEVDSDYSLYLPLPNQPANEQFFVLDLYDEHFYQSLRDNLSDQHSIGYNYIVISYGNDMQNLDFAERIVSKLREWELLASTKVFVKISDHLLSHEVINKEFASHDFVTFGDEKEIVFDIDQIVNEQKTAMAVDRHLSYAITSDLTAEEEQSVRRSALHKWYGWSHVQRESNVYACLSIRLKLHLLGFDYCALHQEQPSANDLYMAKYQQGDPINYDTTANPIKGKLPVLYTNDYVLGSVRQHLAMQEHQRWNAYMIICGVIPSTKAQLMQEGAKNMSMRRHSNITTFDGLVQYRQIMAKRDNVSEEHTDVIRYDYQLMDDVVWLLDNNGYKIIKRD